MKYNKLEIESADHLVFRTAPYPVTTSRGLLIGGGNLLSIESTGGKEILDDALIWTVK